MNALTFWLTATDCMKKKTIKTTKQARSRAAHLWRVTVNDSYTSQTYEIAGTDEASIRDVMNAAKRRLNGKLVREWSGEGGDAPNGLLSDGTGKGV